MKQLSLVGAYRRRTFNQWAANKPSRFLTEIPSEYFNPISGAEQNYMQARQTSVDRYETGVSYEYDEPEIAMGPL